MEKITYITDITPFVYATNDDHIFGNYSGIKQYLLNALEDTTIKYLHEDAREQLNELEQLNENESYNIYCIYDNPMGTQLYGIE